MNMMMTLMMIMMMRRMMMTIMMMMTFVFRVFSDYTQSPETGTKIGN